MKKEITNNEAFFCLSIASAIPLVIDGRRLPADTAASVVMLQVGLAGITDTFEATMQEVLKKLKKEGFDERVQAVHKMEDVDNRLKAHSEWDGNGEEPARPSDGEIEEAEATRAIREDFDRELAELEELYGKARSKELERKVTHRQTPLTRCELADIITVLGTEGDITVKGLMAEDSAISRRDFISFVAANLVE